MSGEIIVSTELEINAPAERIWDVLIDTNNWHRWNKIQSVSGVIVEGGKIKYAHNDIQVAGKCEVHSVDVTVQVADSQTKKLSWQAGVPLKGLLDAIETYHIIPTSEKSSRFVHSLTFRGLLVHIGEWVVMQGWIKKEKQEKAEQSISESYQRVNVSLKEYVENETEVGLMNEKEIFLVE